MIQGADTTGKVCCVLVSVYGCRAICEQLMLTSLHASDSSCWKLAHTHVATEVFDITGHLITSIRLGAKACFLFWNDCVCCVSYRCHACAQLCTMLLTVEGVLCRKR